MSAPDRADEIRAYTSGVLRARDAYTGNTPDQLARRRAALARKASKQAEYRARKKETQQ